MSHLNRTMTWVIGICVLLVFAIVFRARSVSFWLYTAVLVVLIARLVVGLTLRRLRITHSMANDHVFPGERVRFTLKVRNGSPLPAPWVWVEDQVPANLHKGPVFSHVATLQPGQERTYSYEVQTTERGLYRVGRVDVSVGDWFGLRELTGIVDEPRWLTVYPRIVSIPPLKIPARLPVGPRRDPLSPFQDVDPIGLRPYRSGDPLRLIAWKATAHRDELTVKEVPLVRERITYFFLNFSRADWDPGRRFELIERVISVAATLIWWEPDPRHSLGLVAYGRITRSVPEGIGRDVEDPRVLRVAAHYGPAQRRALLETLAGLEPGDGPPFIDMLADEARHLPWGATIVLLVPTNTERLVALAAQLQTRGHPVVILTFEPRRTMGRSGITVHEVQFDMQEVRWA